MQDIKSDLKSFGDKMYQFCCKKDALKEFTDKTPFFEFNDVFPRQEALGLKLQVKETGSLVLDPDMVHPFVRIHIIDASTGMYLQKLAPPHGYEHKGEELQYAPGIYNREACAQVFYE